MQISQRIILCQTLAHFFFLLHYPEKLLYYFADASHITLMRSMYEAYRALFLSNSIFLFSEGRAVKPSTSPLQIMLQYCLTN